MQPNRNLGLVLQAAKESGLDFGCCAIGGIFECWIYCNDKPSRLDQILTKIEERFADVQQAADWMESQFRQLFPDSAYALGTLNPDPRFGDPGIPALLPPGWKVDGTPCVYRNGQAIIFITADGQWHWDANLGANGPHGYAPSFAAALEAINKVAA